MDTRGKNSLCRWEEIKFMSDIIFSDLQIILIWISRIKWWKVQYEHTSHCKYILQEPYHFSVISFPQLIIGIYMIIYYLWHNGYLISEEIWGILVCVQFILFRIAGSWNWSQMSITGHWQPFAHIYISLNGNWGKRNKVVWHTVTLYCSYSCLT